MAVFHLGEQGDRVGADAGRDITELTRSSSLVFTGTVVRLGDSTLSMLTPREHFAVVRVDRGLRVDPTLGDLSGHEVTLDVVGGSPPQVGDRAIFFTRAWLHGDGIAVHEIARADPAAEPEVVRAVAALPDLHLKDRIAAADLVITGQVTSTRRIPEQSRERRAPHWAQATIRVEKVVKGQAGRGPVTVVYPTSDAREWYRAPRLKRGQRGVFVLRRDDPKAAPWLAQPGVPDGAYTALGRADVQGEEREPDARRLLEELN